MRILNLKKSRRPLFRFLNRNQERFECPICGYNGVFLTTKSFSGLRKHAQCPKCGALERHRLQYLVITEVLKSMNTSNLKMLHFAPEPFFSSIFSKQFGKYETADLNMKDVDYHVDIQTLPFGDATYDFVFASHVLEHIHDDNQAIKEIRRVLKPNGIAILPVPVICEKTIEYPEPNPNEFYHMRAPGMDYFRRYERYFSRVEKRTSDLLPSKYQLFVYEDRSIWPTQDFPFRPPMSGEKHIDVVPICYV